MTENGVSIRNELITNLQKVGLFFIVLGTALGGQK